MSKVFPRRGRSMKNFRKIEKYKEGQRLEAKRAAGGLPHSLWETYSSFANTRGGLIVLGVVEWKDRSLHAAGLQYPEEYVKEIWEILSDRTKVSQNILSPEKVRVETVGGKQIVVMEIPKASRRQSPVYLGEDPFSGTYFRKGDGDYLCTDKKVRRMLQRKSGLWKGIGKK